MSTTEQGHKTHEYPLTTYAKDTFKGYVRVLRSETKPVSVLILSSGHKAFLPGGLD